MTVDELKLVAQYVEPKEEKNNIFVDILLCTKSGIKPELKMDENNGNVSYSISLNEISEKEMSNETFYKLCENGWKIEGNNLVFNL